MGREGYILRHRQQNWAVTRKRNFAEEPSDRETISGGLTLSMMTRHDLIAWLGGLVFLCGGISVMMYLGHELGWDADSGYTHYKPNSTSKLRFDPEPYACNETNVKGRHGNRCYGRWYYWKLPVQNVTVLSHAIPWICYSAHQISLWIVIYIAQIDKERTKHPVKFSSKLSSCNWVLLSINAVFFLVHLAQTHWTYDALAQDTSVASSEGAVVLVLAFILIMEYRERGFLLMWPNARSKDPIGKRIRLNQAPVGMIRKYHGYLFSWATTYVFWFHPMENTWGHALGFFHAGMLFLQGSLIYTRIHLNRYWKLLIEVFVLLHGTFIAYQTRNPESYRMHWPMYFLGFGFMLSFNQIFSLEFWKRIHPLVRILPPALFLGIATAMCGIGVIRGNNPDQSNYAKLQEIVYIPLELYALLLVGWLVIYLILRWKKEIHGSKEGEAVTIDLGAVSDVPNMRENGRPRVAQQESNISDVTQEFNEHPSFNMKQALGIAGFLFIHALMIALSVIVQVADVNMTLTSLMFCFVSVYCVCWSLSVMLARMAVTS